MTDKEPRRKGKMWVPKHEPGHIAPNDNVQAIESRPDDPDIDELIAAAREMLRIDCPAHAKRLRKALEPKQ